MTDPHYDAQFRRGYDGPPVAPPVTTAPTAPSWSAEPPVAPHEHSTVIDAPADADAPPVNVVADEESDPLRRRNPWSIALLVVGLIMLVVGGWFLVRGYDITATISVYAPGEQLQVYLQQQFGSALLISGFIAVIAWLVVGALAARSRS